MSTDPVRSEDTELRLKIIEKTEELILAKGHEKTRVVDVAAALSMSHANIYRFFKNRRELLEVVAARWIARSEQALAAGFDGPGTSAERLERGILALLRHKLTQLSEAGGADRVVSMVMAEAGEMARAHMENQWRQLATVLQAGRDLGEFAFDSLQDTTRAVSDAVAAFYAPPLLQMMPDHLEERAKQVVALLVAGLRPRA